MRLGGYLCEDYVVQGDRDVDRVEIYQKTEQKTRQGKDKDTPYFESDGAVKEAIYVMTMYFRYFKETER